MADIDLIRAAPTSLRTISDDIYLLAGILGEALESASGERAFAQTETARTLAKALRGGNSNAGRELDALIGSMPTAEAEALVRAFTNYFQLINLAEDNERIRRIRDRESREGGPRRGSLREAVSLLAARGVDGDSVARLLAESQIRLVLTAHPTEARRRTVIAKLARVFAVLRNLDERVALPDELSRSKQLLAHTIEELWYSDELRATGLTVLDEVRTSLVYLLSTFVEVVPRLYRELEDAFAEFYSDQAVRIPPLFKLGTWIGGDRDGNPNVTPETTRQALEMMRSAAIDVLDAKLLELAGRLSLAETISGPAPALSPRIQDLSHSFPDLATRVQKSNAGEPYRQVLSLMREKLRGSPASEDGRYRTSAELIDDLWLIDRALREQGANLIADGDLRDVIRIAEVFGFHMAVMDIREHANRHAASLDEAFRRAGLNERFLDLNEAERIALLIREIENPRPLIPRTLDQFSPESREVIDTFRMIADVLSGQHQGAIESYVISGTESAADVLSVLLLMKESGLADPGGSGAMLSIVPLFEQERGLRDAPATMEMLLTLPVYQNALRARRNLQEVMIGYSDSNKEIGFLGSAWALYRAQRDLTAVFQAAGVSHTFFHGRGGAIGRGGGPTNVAILAQPSGSVDGRIKLTEQGEVIAARYATTPIAHRELELVMGAVLASTVGILPTPSPARLAEFEAAVSAMSAAAIHAYRELVYEDPDFIRFFEEATPISEIARLQIGSRPARRQQTHQIEDLRAIPWVFSWTQSRFLLPGWFGIGTGLEFGRLKFGLNYMQEMESQWPFFAATIANAEMALAKSDLDIAERYANLVSDPHIRDRIWERISMEHHRATQEILQLTRQSRLLERDPVLRRSIDRRNPYVDPISFVQVELLRRLRAHGDQDNVLRAILRTVNGIAGGLKSTG